MGECLKMKLYVCFLASNSELLESHVLNRAAAWLISAEHPMIHAEVLFADDHVVVGMGDRSALDPGTARKAGAAVLNYIELNFIDVPICRRDCSCRL